MSVRYIINDGNKRKMKFFFLSGCVYTSELLLSVVRLLTQVSQKPIYGSRPNYMGSYISNISQDYFFFFFPFQTFMIFFLYFHYYGTLKNFRTLTLPTNWISPEMLSPISPQSYFSEFWPFEFYNKFSFAFLNMVLYAWKISEGYSSHKSRPNLLLNFCLISLYKVTSSDFWNTDFSNIM